MKPFVFREETSRVKVVEKQKPIRRRDTENYSSSVPAYLRVS